jgi:hypothetical protein
MIELKLDLREPEELRAAAKFFTELADAQDAARQRRMKDYGTIGAIRGAAENRVQAEGQPAATLPAAPAETPKKEAAKKAKPPVFPPTPEPPPETPEPAAPEPAAPPPPAEPGITIEGIRQLMYDKARAGHKVAVKEKLYSYDVKEIKDLPVQHWPDYKDFLEGLNG